MSTHNTPARRNNQTFIGSQFYQNKPPRSLKREGTVKIRNVRAGYPAAPRITFLPLLPLGPDGVRRFLPRRTHPDTPRRIPHPGKDVNKSYLYEPMV